MISLDEKECESIVALLEKLIDVDNLPNFEDETELHLYYGLAKIYEGAGYDLAEG